MFFGVATPVAVAARAAPRVEAKYESMPADLQQIMDDHAGMYFAKLGGEFFKNAENYGRKLIDENATRSQMPAAEVKKMQEATAGVPGDWVKEMDGLGLPGQRLLDSANAMLEKYSN